MPDEYNLPLVEKFKRVFFGAPSGALLARLLAFKTEVVGPNISAGLIALLVAVYPHLDISYTSRERFL